MREIPITGGGFTIVDECDEEYCKSRRIFLAGMARYPSVTHWVDGKKHVVALHRVLLGLKPGDRQIVDHINRNRFDNRRSNLRIVTSAQNAQNRSRARNNTTGFKGVRQVRKWFQGWAAGEYLGLFSTAEDAARAYDAIAKARFGEFANLNFPEAA